MKKKKLVIILVIILILVALLAFKIFLSSKNNFKTVSVANAVKKNLVQFISLSGNIKANEFEEIALPSTQKVLDILISEGQEVTKGQALLKLDAYDLENQSKKIKINLQIANKELEKLKDAENNTTKKNMDNSVKLAKLALQNAESKYEDAKRRHEQNIKLYNAGFLSKEEFETSKSNLNDLEINVTNMELNLDNAENSLKDFDDRIYQQEKQMEIYNADLENLQRNIANSNIRANINGKIVRLGAKKNQYPMPGSSILIHDLSQYKLELSASQYDAVNIKEGQKAEIKIKGLDKVFHGTVTKIGETATMEMSGSNKETKVLVEITLNSEDEHIKVGYEADAEITLMEKENSIAVGFEAVQTDEEGKKYIFVLEGDLAKKRFVETGLETDFEIEITSGLKENEKYITNPPTGLRDGETVKVIGGI